MILNFVNLCFWI